MRIKSSSFGRQKETLSSSNGHEFSSTDRHKIQLTRTILANCKATAKILRTFKG